MMTAATNAMRRRHFKAIIGTIETPIAYATSNAATMNSPRIDNGIGESRIPAGKCAIQDHGALSFAVSGLSSTRTPAMAIRNGRMMMTFITMPRR